MQQNYHRNAKTNVHFRTQIQGNNSLLNAKLIEQLGISKQTISKWKNRDFNTDASSRPHHIKYALSEIETTLAISLRTSSWLPLDEVFEMLLEQNKLISRSSVYRCWVKNNLNKVPQIKRDEAKKFKAYEPGYIHFDVTYMPKFKGQAAYLFVAIDRATRTMFFDIYDTKSALSTDDFFDKCLDFFPFKFTHILTDNGLEFTNRFIMSKKGTLCTKASLLDIKCEENNIQHRLTLPYNPQTNGMVERVNGTIKNNTILKTKYKNASEMNKDLFAFLSFYNLFRRHGLLRKELNVKTPFQAIEKWFQLKPELFKINPTQFKNKILNLTIKIIN